jgi:methylglutaconyl-CoA hydratase
MTDDSVLIDIRADGRATLTLNRPAVHNAFDDALIRRLNEAVASLRDDPAVRLVVVAAAGKSFSAGADLNWLRRAADYTADENLADVRALARLLDAFNRLPKPTIAAVQGPAYGGGVGLVACCDIAIASQKARFSMSEVKLGLIPGTVSPYVIGAIGERQARRYMLTGERFDAAEALRIGLVHAVVGADALAAAVDDMVDVLLDNGPKALAETKELIAAVARRPIDGRLIDDTAARFARIRASEEGREGIRAFLEKRNPAWTKK